MKEMIELTLDVYVLSEEREFRNLLEIGFLPIDDLNFSIAAQDLNGNFIGTVEIGNLKKVTKIISALESLSNLD